MRAKSHHTRKRLGRRSRLIGRASNKRVAPRTAEEFFAKSQRFRDTWNRVVQVPSRMRSDGSSLRRTAQALHVDPRTVVRQAHSALRKQKNGRYVAKARDRLLRVLVIPGPGGLREIALRDSRQASRLGEYWAAAQRYLETGDASAIQKFIGKHITDADGKRILLLTNLEEMDRQANAGNLSFETIYAKL